MAAAEKKDAKLLDPLLFISHKHVNARIAKVLEDFVTTRSAGNVRVYLSSDPESKGPRIGKNLGSELKNALWEAGAVVLIYTSPHLDWSYCMYECGVAIDPKSSDTKVYVLQCGNDAPAPFTETVRVRAKSLKDIEKFTKALLTDEDFFPGYGRKVANFSPDSPKVKAAAKDLFDELQKVLPQEGPVEKWSAWPSIQIEITQEGVAELAKATPNERRELLLAKGSVITAGSGIAGLFGWGDLSIPLPLQKLLDAWTNEYPKVEPRWLDAMGEQIVNAADRQVRDVRWALFRKVDGDRQYLPALSSVSSSIDEGTVKFDFCFQHHSKATPVEARMTRINRIERENLDRTSAEKTLLKSLLEKYEAKNWNRIPIVAGDDIPRYIIHVSMINMFVRRQAYSGNKVESLTLADLLNEPQMAQMFEATFAVVSADATLTDAKREMNSIEGCQDVFVTESGTRNETVVGWLTDRDIATETLWVF